MNTNANFIPKPLEIQDVGNFELGTLKWREYLIGMVKSKMAPPGAVFLPKDVLDGNRHVLWSFKGDHPGYKGLARLEQWEEELVIVLASKYELHMVIPIMDLPHIVGQTAEGDLIGGRGIKKLLPMKEGFAKAMKVVPAWTTREAAMREALLRQERERREAEEEARRREAEERREATRRERAALRAGITERRRVYAYTASGDRRHGVPVVGDEWRILTADVYCISVESYDTLTGEHGAVRECFITKRTHGGNIEKDRVTEVFERAPLEEHKLCALVTRIVHVKGELEEVVVVSSMDDVQKLNDGGLNSGALVMVEAEGADTFPIYRLESGVIKSIAHVKHV